MGKSTEVSAGLVLWDIIDGVPKILLVKAGGPYFWNKHKKCYGIPKGHVEQGENLLTCAIREFEEETGIRAIGPFDEIPYAKYGSGKLVYAWAFRSKFNGVIKSNMFSMEWPPKSGKFQEFPEVEKPGMFSLDEAKEMIMISQECYLESLKELFKSKNLI
ncbi:MAG: NUDIX domain-containing protein [Candidatus Pacearchaeota archaeon]|jgi:predicted NUDIX family NTP pyrophosphohydrolase|nr:NUDIX domain-containing protein [Clostridia bacterium]